MNPPGSGGSAPNKKRLMRGGGRRGIADRNSIKNWARNAQFFYVRLLCSVFLLQELLHSIHLCIINAVLLILETLRRGSDGLVILGKCLPSPFSFSILVEERTCLGHGAIGEQI